MTFKADYEAVLDQLKLSLDPSVLSWVKKVQLGTRAQYEEMPAILIQPRRDNIQDQQQATVTHMATFDIVNLEINDDHEAGTKSIALHGAEVYDTLIKDRSLNGKVNTLFIDAFEPDYEPLESNSLYWCLNVVRCRMYVG